MEKLRYCAAPPRIMPMLPADIPAERRRAIVVGRAMWANGTKLRYAFLDGGRDEQKAVVRESFAEWKEIGIGLDFAEVSSPAEAEVRIGFEQGDGSWSYLGRDVLQIGQSERTMNFGWDLTTPHGRATARHEIGHTLGMPHEHQNPNAGIVWDEEAVYTFLGGPPNNWPREKTFHNVLRKLDPAEVKGSDWDPESVMEYAFPSGLVITPEEYKKNGIRPPGTISKIDMEQVLIWYPGLEAQLPRLTPFQSTPLSLRPSEQFNAEIVPDASREYSIGTFGSADMVLVLFEEDKGELRFLAGDDDSGQARNALIKVKLFEGRRYVVRARMYYSWASGSSAVMYW